MFIHVLSVWGVPTAEREVRLADTQVGLTESESKKSRAQRRIFHEWKAMIP